MKQKYLASMFTLLVTCSASWLTGCSSTPSTEAKPSPVTPPKHPVVAARPVVKHVTKMAVRRPVVVKKAPVVVQQPVTQIAPSTVVVTETKTVKTKKRIKRASRRPMHMSHKSVATESVVTTVTQAAPASAPETQAVLKGNQECTTFCSIPLRRPPQAQQ